MSELTFEDVSISYRSGGDRGTVDAVRERLPHRACGWFARHRR